MRKDWKIDIKEMMTYDFRIKEVKSHYTSAGKKVFCFVVEKCFHFKQLGDTWLYYAHSKYVGYRTALKFAAFHRDDCAIHDIKECR